MYGCSWDMLPWTMGFEMVPQGVQGERIDMALLRVAWEEEMDAMTTGESERTFLEGPLHSYHLCP